MKPVTVEFSKAVSRLGDALAQPKNDFLRDSVIQRFEFSIELAWKTARKVMGTATTAPKDIVREMAQAGYITDVEDWLRGVDMRNLSSHTYKEDLAELVYGFAKSFFPELQRLAKFLSSR
jgi:nucleotidyltransferase substrate binding protein (TIGR01987 family)